MATINQKVRFNASPAAVYRALMDENEHAAFTGASAEIDPQVGGTFVLWDGYATGTTIELELNQKIVQEWRASDWPEGVHSIATFELEAEDEDTTELTFTQSGVPDSFKDEMAEGWEDFYWKPLATYLERE